MADRIDYLGSSLQHLDSLKGDVISREADPQLQAIAAEVGKILGTPIALLTIMMKRTQLFRASFGLPSELAAARSTDRALAWCQLVVRDRSPLTVTHASSDARIPQDLVKRFGLEAYLGVPVPLRRRCRGIPVRHRCRRTHLQRERHCGPHEVCRTRLEALV